MKIAVQLGLLPGNTPKEKQKWAADNGVDGIEVSAWNYKPDQLDQALKDFEKSPVPVSTICGNASFNFVDPDPKLRAQSVEESKKYLEFCGKVGAVGQIFVPIFGGPKINDLSPYKDAITLEKDLLVESLKPLVDHAAKNKTQLLLEPLNRYETHLICRQAQAVEIIKRVKKNNLKLMSDFFHMHIEELNTPATFRSVGKYVAHVHLADNTRQEPGSGDIDWVAGMKALLDINFKGYMAYECGLRGEDKGKTLAKSLQFVRDSIQKARELGKAPKAKPGKK